MIHAMIDIETLGVGPNAPMFEVAVQFFNLEDGKELAFGHWHLDLMDVMWRTGRCPQQETLNWWVQQKYDPTMIEDRVVLREALDGIQAMYSDYEVDKTWANSPSFDLVILEGHWSVFGEDTPWTYKQELDFRTVRWIAQRKGWKEVGDRVPSHNALEDCRLQTTVLLEMLNV